jgi:signal transduction histidine kinase
VSDETPADPGEVGLVLYGADGRVRYASVGARSLLGLEDDSTEGWSEVEFDERLRAHGAHWERQPPDAPSTEPVLIHRRHRLPDGGHVDLFQPLERSTAERKAHLEVALHDLRSPLAGVHTYASLLASGKLNDPARCQKVGQQMVRKLEDGLQLVQDYLDLELSELGPLSLYLEPTDVVALVNEALDSRRQRASEFGFSFELSASHPEAPIVCQLDAARIGRAIRALLDEVLLRSKPGDSGHIEIEERSHEICVGISDSGPELRGDALMLAFDPFYRVWRDHRLHPGLALGVARATALAHGGSVGITTAPEATTFHLTLPRLVEPN